jgi:hypothetical protein
MYKRSININIIFYLLFIIFLSGCDFLFGTKKDEQLEEIFEQGKIDPNLIQNNIGYVPILPVWNTFDQPVDIFVGYDEMIYVVDNNGVHVLDLKGQLHRTIPVYKASKITQDRRIHTYVAGKVKVMINNKMQELAAVYRIKNTASAAGPVFVDTLIHPFCDESRRIYPFSESKDLDVSFSGLAVRADNVLYLARKGKENNTNVPYRPDNTVLIFDPDGNNIAYAIGLSPNLPSLRSAIEISSLATFTGPPQSLYGVNKSPDFLLCQSAQDIAIEYRVLWIKEEFDPDAGTKYVENSALLDKDRSKADRFLYDPFRFQNPEDIYIAPDQSGLIFIVDSGLDSLFVFTRNGAEGIYPPPTSNAKKNIIVSFGGEGYGQFQFKNPSGVCYYKKIVYVADKGNNRIMRYQLNIDLE